MDVRGSRHELPVWETGWLRRSLPDHPDVSIIIHPPWESTMLWTIAVILLILWALGLFSGYAMGGLVHVLLVIALIMVVLQFLSGRRVG